ncbi:hypothetical protein ACJMK2_034599 [Sinanodonta woodiana]|uniref:Endonuclease/exonuclease/phosphatase domain-containing protein n=1 Tax=Sinanodonta woodiana TaxID=1069815 RepID=A0ABD3WW87_SINWO
MASKSKGARLKTSSTSKRSKKCSKKCTVVEKPLLKVLIMNVSGVSEGKLTAERRKQTIVDIIDEHNPILALFQEFTWKKTCGKVWKSYTLPRHYQIIGNKEASIMYNTNEVTVTERGKETKKLQRYVKELQRPTSKDPTPIYLDIESNARMALIVLETKGVPVMKFICISWHGNHAGMTNDGKVTEFKNLMFFLNDIYKKFKLPILIAGDFNVKMKSIRHKVQYPFKLYEYEASERRKKKGVIDYFIATTELHLSNIKPVDLKKYSKAYNPEKVFDHDPIKAILELDSSSDSSCSEYDSC